MAAKKITYVATATIDGVEYTKTRTSARPYTHAAFHKATNPAAIEKGNLYGATFHSSEALAIKSGDDKANGANYAVVAVTIQGAEVKPEPVAEAPKVEAPAKPKRVRKAAAPKPQVDPALAEIVAFVLGGVVTAKTEVSKAVLSKAAGQLKSGDTEAARKTLYPIRTRVALKAIKMIKAL